jgi:type I restriction enzyme S subunit
MNKLEKVLLKEIADIQTGPFGTQLHEKDYVSQGTPIVTVEHLGEISFNKQNLPLISDADKLKLSKYTLKEGDIVFSRVGSIDRCTYVSSKENGWLFSGRCLRVRFNDNTNAKYVSFYFRQKFFKEMMLNISVGATMPSLNTSLMANIPLYLPNKEVQYKIASVLSALDSKIEINNRINAELEAMAKCIYDYWFVQFDFPDKNGKPYKSSGGKMVWNEELKRDIPEGWEVKRLEDCMRIVRGASPRPIDDFMSETGAPWIKISDATSIDHWFIIETKEFIKEEGVKHSRELKPGTLILSNSASPGIPRIVQIRSCVHDGWLIVDSLKNGLYNEFMLFYFENFRSKILNMGSGSIFKNLKTEYIKDLRIALPPEDLLESSRDIFRNNADQILNYVKQNQQLATLRDWLLPMLMNGQIKIN